MSASWHRAAPVWDNKRPTMDLLLSPRIYLCCCTSHYTYSPFHFSHTHFHEFSDGSFTLLSILTEIKKKCYSLFVPVSPQVELIFTSPHGIRSNFFFDHPRTEIVNISVIFNFCQETLYSFPLNPI